MNNSQHHRYSLKQYTRLIIAFYGCLLVLTFAQYNALKVQGVVDNIITISLGIATIHQIGFASILGLLLVAPFNFFENLRPKYGFRLVTVCLGITLAVEVLLTAYFLIDLTAFGAVENAINLDEFFRVMSRPNFKVILLYVTVGLSILLIVFFGLYKGSLKFYEGLGRLYPFTIILFSLFLMALFTQGKPVDQNKTQFLVATIFSKDNSLAVIDSTALNAKANSDDSVNTDRCKGKLKILKQDEFATLQNKKPFIRDSLKATDFTNGEVVYIHSTYNGNDADREFKKARNLAIDQDYQRAILICRHILSEVPNHIDAKILMGRLHAWQG